MAAGPVNIARKGICARGAIASHRVGKPGGAIIHPEPFTFTARAATYAFAPPRAGYWKFVLWGAGGGGGGVGSSGGASGAYAEVARFLSPVQTVTIIAGMPFDGTARTDSTVTFPDGSIVVAGSANFSIPGIATGADFSINGTAGVGTGNLNGNPGGGSGGGAGGVGVGGLGSGGAGAPARLPYRGGAGQTDGRFAGIGAGSVETQINAGLGYVLAMLLSE